MRSAGSCGKMSGLGRGLPAHSSLKLTGELADSVQIISYALGVSRQLILLVPLPLAWLWYVDRLKAPRSFQLRLAMSLPCNMYLPRLLQG